MGGGDMAPRYSALTGAVSQLLASCPEPVAVCAGPEASCLLVFPGNAGERAGWAGADGCLGIPSTQWVL